MEEKGLNAGKREREGGGGHDGEGARINLLFPLFPSTSLSLSCTSLVSLLTFFSFSLSLIPSRVFTPLNVFAVPVPRKRTAPPYFLFFSPTPTECLFFFFGSLSLIEQCPSCLVIPTSQNHVSDYTQREPVSFALHSPGILLRPNAEAEHW
ncbi:hypothetical protein DFJ73DRAFT_220805 [Zopfochytrium polystomum]|nr:hypothetical protein DFJ73DRAFT_220805 [Zopfochytrium polystomum]